jgi:hypothetical protein
MSKLYAEQDISKLAVLKSNNDTIAMKVSGTGTGKPRLSSMLNDIAMKVPVSGKPWLSTMLNDIAMKVPVSGKP